MDLLPKEELIVEVLFTPSIEKVYHKQFPVELLGSDSKSIRIDIKTRAIPSPIKINRSEITFQNAILSPFTPTTKLTIKEILSFWNTTDDEIEWFFEDQSMIDEAVFTFEPSAGVLKIGQSQDIVFTFNPEEPSTFNMMGVLIANCNQKYIKFGIPVKGKCVHPSISFEPAELFLPVVPNGTMATVPFWIINHGCEITEVNAIVPPDLRKDNVLLELLFPDGCRLKADGEKLPCIARFTYKPNSQDLESSNCLSFITRIQFCGIYPSSYYLMIHGTSAACPLTLQPYLFKNQSGSRYSLSDKKQILFESQTKDNKHRFRIQSLS